MFRIVSVSLLVLSLSAAFAPTQAVFTFDATSFCERYSAALYAVSNSTTQERLITAVIDRALNGAAGTTPLINGILNYPLQMAIFNGSRNGGTNYYTNSVAYQSLRGKLVNFFATAMLCRAMTLTPTSQLGPIHSPFNIDKPTWDQFINEVANTLFSFGVPSTTTEPSETNYVLALMAQFLKGSTANSICTAATCLSATGYAEFTTGSDDSAGTGTSTKRWLANDGTYQVTIPLNGYIHWNIGTIHNVVQTDSAFANVVAGGFTSGAPGASRTWTKQFTTAGTYYFYCQVHSGVMHGTIVVTQSGSPASSFPASLAVVLAAIVAAVALLRV